MCVGCAGRVWGYDAERRRCVWNAKALCGGVGGGFWGEKTFDGLRGKGHLLETQKTLPGLRRNCGNFWQFSNREKLEVAISPVGARGCSCLVCKVGKLSWYLFCELWRFMLSVRMLWRPDPQNSVAPLFAPPFFSPPTISPTFPSKNAAALSNSARKWPSCSSVPPFRWEE